MKELADELGISNALGTLSSVYYGSISLDSGKPVLTDYHCSSELYEWQENLNYDLDSVEPITIEFDSDSLAVYII